MHNLTIRETSSPPRRVSFLISTQDLQNRLVQRQGAILEQLGDVLRMQRQSRTLISEVAARQADEGKWQPRDLDVLQSADLQQRQVVRLLKNPDDELAKQIELLLAETQANRLGEEGIASRMLSLQKQIRRLSDDVLPPLEEQMATASERDSRSEQNRQESDSSDSPTSRCRSTASPSSRTSPSVRIEAMLGELAQWDSFSRIAREVGLLKQEQQKLRERTRKCPRRSGTCTARRRAARSGQASGAAAT